MNERFIPLSVPNLKGNELKYVTEAVETEWVSTGGSYVEKFEKEVADYVGAKGAVACQNGTSGLHIALLLTGVAGGERVIVPTLTFIAAVNPVKYIGAEPIFIDCDDTLCIDPEKLEQFCREECEVIDDRLYEIKSGQRIRTLLVVHVFGNMANMERICDIAQNYHLKIVEDATEAIGTHYETGKFAGKYAGTIGDIGVYSFNGNKIITTGGGGMIVSDDDTLLKKAKHLTTQAKSDELYYTHDQVGYNYRMTNLQAALGLAQMEQLEKFIKIKITNYERYCKKLEGIHGLRLLPFREGVRSNHWFYALYCDGFCLDRDSLIQFLNQNKIQSRPIWGLIHEQNPYKTSRNYCIEKATTYWKHVVNIPCSTNLSCDDIDTVIDVIRKAQ